MKKVLFFAVLTVFAMTTSFAQDEDGGGDPTSQGAWVIEINTGFGEASSSNTGFFLWSRDGNTAWGIGGEAGYFVLDDLALKAGLGYSDGSGDDDGFFNWKFGGKYYIVSQFPVGVDVNGSSGDDWSPLWVGFQGGYAWFLSDDVSIEPGIRYGLGLNEDAGDGDFNIFSGFIGFNFYLN